MFKTRQLRLAAEELVEVLLLTEKDAKGKKVPVVIDEEASPADLIEMIKEAIEIIEAGDEFTPATQAVIDELKVEDDDAPTPAKKKAAPVEDDDDPDQEAAEAIHKKNIADKPVNAGKRKVVIPDDDDPDLDEDAPPVKKKKVIIPDDDDDDPDAEEEKPKKTAKKEPKEKKERVPSAYGTSVSIMCKTPDITIAELNKQLKKLGIDVEGGKSAVQTGFGVVRKIVSLLRENSLMD